MSTLNAYKVSRKETQTLLKDGATKVISLPLIRENTVRNLRIDVVGWRLDESVNPAVNHPDSQLLASRAVLVTRTTSNTSADSGVKLLPTVINSDGGSPAAYIAGDYYDAAGFGTTAAGGTPLTVTYQNVADGIDTITLAWNSQTASQSLVASVIISWDDVPLTLL